MVPSSSFGAVSLSTKPRASPSAPGQGSTPAPLVHVAEQALAAVSSETGLEMVVVRSPLVYGPGVGGNFLQLLKIIRAGVPLPLALVENRRSFIFLGNLVDALILSAQDTRAAGRTYLVSDGDER